MVYKIISTINIKEQKSGISSNLNPYNKLLKTNIDIKW